MTYNLMLIPLVEVELDRIAALLAQALSAKQSTDVVLLPTIKQIEVNLAANKKSELLEAIVVAAKNDDKPKDFTIMSGIALAHPYAAELNYAIATALDAKIIFVLAAKDDNASTQAKIIANQYHGKDILGFITVSDFINSQLIDFISNNFCMVGDFIVAKQEQLQNLNLNWAEKLLLKPYERKITPPMFRQQLIDFAQKAYKRIVLPEGTEPRTLHAANICAERGIAQCILLGEKNDIFNAAKKNHLELNEKIMIIEPQLVIDKYVTPLFELRRSKGLTMEEARVQLQDTAMLGTMMLKLGEMDGLVSGAIHTTANTIRPALQIIKTVPGTKAVSSVMFMCLPEQVLIYGDCAINQKPNAEDLADIAIHSADSAVTFGFPARVAMLSYSTGGSGFGEDVDKIKTATEIVRQKRSDILIEGPIQYDAAIDAGVAALKAPQSKVAGRATVFIFPDLNAGNIAYKMVQRSTGIICIGPMLQGLQKPVNDLSRGCLVEDIVFTIALTAVQATNSKL